MKRLLLISLIFITCIKEEMPAASIFVSPSGSDTNAGTISSPFYSLNKAWSIASSGDIIYMRGGTYYYASSQSLTNKSGTSTNLIKIWAYQDERPVIDHSPNTYTSQMRGIYMTNANYIHLKGIRITGIKQPQSDISQYGIYIWTNCSNNIFEQIETDHIGGWGIVWNDGCSNNLFLNCDSHHNQDPSTGYGGADGFEGGSHGQYGGSTSTNITFRGCRAWSNSDDGWDLRQSDGVFMLENCWSFNNGYIPDTEDAGGNGVGFKLGGKQDGTPGTNEIRRIIRNSLSVNNRMTGISPEPDGDNCRVGTVIENCVAYGHDDGNGNSNGIASGGYGNYTEIRNCISFSNYNNFQDNDVAVHNHNSFDTPVVVNTADFVSMDVSQLSSQRKADGSLPDITLLHLTGTSDLIDTGVNVGLPYNGAAPDQGAFEYGIFHSTIGKLIKSNGKLIIK